MANYSVSQLKVLKYLLSGRIVEIKCYYQGEYRGLIHWQIEEHRFSWLIRRTYTPKSISRSVSRRYVSIEAFLREFCRARNYYVSTPVIDDIPF